ncbi:Ig-like domain repeat protein [Frigoribacterium sp. VKM Ac-2836]|uniref:Ig-like domain repeat protein n=1 Tax=Frigoribacterium sp. VKM Ac-2836 TaxID=2739014 RepID=UPI001565C782|nr:Ig-like domain repeat protein [Frigoribacterium sp. VKM Ac-2836]NRD27424.1 Ig-like domain repeat protein [Frigoribacterium sp. VKM Ac-2836]
MPSFPIRRLAATTAAAALVLTALATAPAQAASPPAAASAAAPVTTSAASTTAAGAPADLSRDMVTVPAAPLLRARTDDAVSPATGVTTHPVYVSVATVTAATSDDSPTPPDEASIRAAVTQLHDYWWAESGHTVDVTLAGIETRPLGQASCVPATVLNTVHTAAFGGRFAKYAWAGTNEHLIVLSRETCGTTATAFGTVGGDGGEVFSSYGAGSALGVPVLLHEFGHNLGFGHAGAGMCRSTTSFDGAASDYRYATSTDSPAACPVLEYGDFLDIMGYSVSSARPHLSSVQRVRAGFMTDVTTLSGAGTTRQVVVTSLDGTATGRALKVVDPISGQDYYVEYRTATGTDATSAEFGGRAASCAVAAPGFTRCGLTSDRTTGSVRVLRPLTLAGSTVSTVALAVGLDTKRDPSRRDTHLDAGESFTSANGGFTVSVRSMTPSGGAVLDVTLAGAAKQQPVAAPAPASAVATASTLTVDRTRQTYGSPTRITATTRVVTTDGSTPTGTVTLRDGTTTVGSARVGTDGRAAVTLPATTRSGAHPLRASFVPDTAAQAGSTSAIVTVTVDKASSTSALSTGTTPVKRNAAANVTVTVASPGVARPEGVVTVSAGGTVLGSTRLTSASGGRVSVPVSSFTRAGVYALTASYAGTDDVSASVSKRMIVVVR